MDGEEVDGVPCDGAERCWCCSVLGCDEVAGAALMDAVIANEPRRFVLSGQMTVESFYKRWDVETIGEPYLEEVIDHVWMERRY